VGLKKRRIMGKDSSKKVPTKGRGRAPPSANGKGMRQRGENITMGPMLRRRTGGERFNRKEKDRSKTGAKDHNQKPFLCHEHRGEGEHLTLW